MNKKRIIMFSSSEGLQLAQHVQKSFYPKEYSVRLWTNGLFELSKPYINNFLDIKKEYDFAIFIISNDDVVKYRNKKYSKPRDNIIFEIGICIGTFGLESVIIAKPEFVTLPSDLMGIGAYDYYIDSDMNITAGVIYAEIDSYIKNKMQTANDFVTIDWKEYCCDIKKIVDDLRRPLYLGGFEFDFLIGINRGGLMTADLISREYGHHMPVLTLFADRRNKIGVFDSEDMMINNKDIIAILKNDRIKNILLVDSFSRRGKTIINAKAYLESNLPEKQIKTALIYADKDINLKGKVDYISRYRELKNVTFSLI